jgi:hypothetical protein
VSVVGGAPDPGPRTNRITGETFFTIDRLVGVASQRGLGTAIDWADATELGLVGTWLEPCVPGGVYFPRAVGAEVTIQTAQIGDPIYREYATSFYFTNCGSQGGIVGSYQGFQPAPPSQWKASTTLKTLAPVRRQALDGGQYDASPMQVKRNDAAWYTHFWGYRLGLVANESNFVDADRSKLPVGWSFFPSPRNNFELATLPPPWVEDEVVEYVNRADFPQQPGGQYFYAVRAEDKTLLDSLPVWQRTGKNFKSGGYVSACRFYGGKNGGPNTHFYSADDKECAALKAIPQLSYEGQTFAVNVPLPGAAVNGVKPCPVGSKPLYRVYNNASASSGRFVSNHRYLTERADVAAVVAQGWVDEGQAMCVPL